MSTSQNLKQLSDRAQEIVASMSTDHYNDNVTALVSAVCALIVTLISTAILTGSALLLCVLYSGLAMVLFVSRWSSSPAVQNTAKLWVPRVAVSLVGVMVHFAHFVFASTVYITALLLGPVRLDDDRPIASIIAAVKNDSCSTAEQEIPSVRDSTVNTLDVPENLKVECIVPKSSNTDTFKYWKKRFNLFSKFDMGVMLDDESFYSVCPEILSSYIAQQCKGVTVAVDPFCGAGGNVIQLAKLYDKVIAVDIDPKKIKLAQHNAKIYGVLHKIKFIVGDFFSLQEIKADVLVTSPPWGGPAYSQKSIIDPSDLYINKILELGKKMAPKMLLHLPKNVDKVECLQVCCSAAVDVKKLENVFIDRYLNCLLMYVRSNNNNSVTDMTKRDLRPIDIHLHNSFRKNEERDFQKTYQSYVKDVDRFLSSRG